MADSQFSQCRREQERAERTVKTDLGWEECSQCHRDMEESQSEIWYVGGRKMESDPIPTPDGNLVCSQKCLSQYIHDHLTAEDREELCNLARLSHQWSELIGATLDRYCLKHMAISKLIPAMALRDLQMAFRELDEALGVEDEPAWYLKATEAK